MVLPLLAGFAGSALASAGALGGLSPLIAGAVGSGLGTFAETGDAGKGLQAGLGGLLMGGTLGGSLGTAAGKLGGAAGAAQAAGQSGAGAAAAGQAAGQAASQAGQQGIMGGIGSMFEGAGQNLADLGPDAGLGQKLMSRDAIKGYTGALAGAAQGYQPSMPNIGQDEEEARYRQLGGPRYTSRRGSIGETNYGFPTNYKRGGHVTKMQEGGGIAAMMDQRPQQSSREPVQEPNEKQVISDAMAAIEGRHPQPEIALGRYLAMFGAEDLRALIKDVTSGQAMRRAIGADGGKVRGPGDGEDMIPATVEGGKDVLLADGEFVMREPTVTKIGNGDNDEGARKLEDFMNQVDGRGRAA